MNSVLPQTILAIAMFVIIASFFITGCSTNAKFSEIGEWSNHADVTSNNYEFKEVTQWQSQQDITR